MTHRILLVEDEQAISAPLEYLLGREGYQVTTVADGNEAVRTFNDSFDLVLLDLMLPGLPGTEVCRTIRSFSTVPIIMLTAKDSEVDVVVGLELGADDYITKPYGTRELIARIRAVMRRRQEVENVGNSSANADKAGDVLSEQGVTLDTDRYTLQVHGVEVPVPLREFELLEFLMRNSGRVLTRAQLIDRVWGADYFGDTKTLDVHIKRLRGRIEENPAKPQLITTVRGVGYRFC